MKTVSYKLDRYKIIEFESGELWWEAYAGFAGTMSGKCFVKGSILFISPSHETSAPGFLIMEYNQFLERLPLWRGTRYYCHDYVIKNCNDGKVLTKEEMIQWSREETQPPADEIKNTAKRHPEEKPGPASYRLGRYEIAGHEESGFIWKIQTEPDRLKTGKCYIEGDVLFIGDDRGTETGVLKGDYSRYLAELPRWTKTRYYSDRYSLNDCQAGHLPSMNEKQRTEHEVSLPPAAKVNKRAAAGGKEKTDDAPKAQAGRFQMKKPGFLEIFRKYRFPKELPRAIRPPKLHLLAGLPQKYLKGLVGAGVFLTVAALLAGGAILVHSIEDDKHKHAARHRKSDDRSREHSQRDGRRATAGAVSSAESSSYRSSCGGCHLAYPPDLLPSRSWQKMIAGLDNHFGEAVALEAESKKIISAHLTLNAAEYSRSKHAKEIMESIGDQDPIRITGVPYIQRKHRKIPASFFDSESIGSLSNCPACHKAAERGNYEGDEAVIPR